MSDENRERLVAALSKFNDLNLPAALKTNLGEVSIGGVVEPRISATIERCQKAGDFVDGVNRLQIIPLADAITAFAQFMGLLTTTEPANFIGERNNFIAEITNRIDQIEIALLPFDVAQNRMRIEGALGGNEADIERVRSTLKAEADAILQSVKTEAESVLEEAREKASAIQNTARDTATGVSVLQIGVRFADLIGTFKTDLMRSGTVACLAFVAFVCYVIWLVFHQPELKSVPEAIYATAVRVTLLASIAAVVTFSLKIFRSNLHMYYHTLHRQQLTNSIQSFVDAARTDDHRDAVLTKLIEAVSTFSTSGLVSSSDDMPNTAKIIIDALPKALGKTDH